MEVIEYGSVERFTLPGLLHQTLAGAEQGLEALEVWLQTLAPGASLPAHYHECEEVVIVLRGEGEIVAEGARTSFGPESTVIFPPGRTHQLLNTGQVEILLVAAFSESPTRTFAPDGEPMALPWRKA